MLNQEIRFCTASDGARIAYGITGEGPPLVFPSTIQTHLELDPGLLGYRHWLEGLSRHHTLVRGELRGAGLSDWEVPSMGFDDWVADLEAMVDHAGLERFPLFGLSHGTAEAIAYAAKHPERVSHLVLYAASGSSWLDALPPEALPRFAAYRQFLLAFWDSVIPRMQHFFTADIVPEASAEIVAALDEVRRRSMSPENALRALDTIVSTDVMHLLPAISVPTLVLHPRRGSAVTIATARKVAAAIPEARFVVLECDNHLMQEYEPGWPVLLDETWRFLGVDPSANAKRNGNGSGAVSAGPGLSQREKEVLALIADHRTNVQIAESLTITHATASKHVHSILGKLGVSRRSEAAAWWLNDGNGSGGGATPH